MLVIVAAAVLCVHRRSLLNCQVPQLHVCRECYCYCPHNSFYYLVGPLCSKFKVRISDLWSKRALVHWLAENYICLPCLSIACPLIDSQTPVPHVFLPQILPKYCTLPVPPVSPLKSTVSCLYPCLSTLKVPMSTLPSLYPALFTLQFWFCLSHCVCLTPNSVSLDCVSVAEGDVCLLL